MSAPIAWPYPFWVAHRGAGKLAPENTLAAFKVGARHGYRMFECDVKLSADGVPFLLHDATLDRTTGGKGSAGLLAWRELAQLDAGGWHSSAFVGEPLATLEQVSRYCVQNGLLLNIEIKPTPGLEAVTGAVVADAAAHLWKDAPAPPLLTSFDTSALEAAWRAQPQLPRGLLLDEWHSRWLQAPIDLQCVALICNHKLWSEHNVSLARDAGLKTLSYTVNDLASAQRLTDWGTDGIITDRVDTFSPA